MVAAVLMCSLCTVPVYATELGDAKKKKTSMEEEKKKVEASLKNLEGLKSDAAAYVKALDSDMETLSGQLGELDSQIAQKNEEIQAAKEQYEEAKAQETHQYENMKLRIRYMYERGETSFLDLLFEASDMSQLLNRAEYIEAVSVYDRKMLETYAKARQTVKEQGDILEAEQEELLAMQDSLEAKKASVETLLQEKQRQLSSYESQITTAQGQLDAYEADLKAQEAKIKQIEDEIKRKEEEAKKAAQAAGKTYNTASIGNIKFIWPCPSSGRITSGFGARSSPTEGASTNHKGIDIGASTGSGIVAAAAGEVIISTYSYSAGNYIMISHGGGVYTVYMHCSELLVSAGATVSQGQTIAKVGSTGYSTGSHLHFGIRVNGNYVNPSSYVSP